MHEGVWETRFLFILQPWAFVVVVPIQGRKGGRCCSEDNDNVAENEVGVQMT